MYLYMNHFLRGLLLAALMVSFRSGQAQTYFNNRYAVGSTYSAATTMIANGNGVVVAGAGSRVPGRVEGELFLAFIDSAGVLQRVRYYKHRITNDMYSGVLPSLMRLPDGGMALVSNSNDTIRGLLWRFNAQGDTLWTRVFTSQFALVTRSGCVLPDGGFLLTGDLSPSLMGGNNTGDAFVIRTDSLGQELWRRTFDINRSDGIEFSMPTPDGGYLLTGYTITRSGGGPTEGDGLVIKLDANGNTQWQRIIGRPGYTEGAGLAVRTPDGGYLVNCVLGVGPIGFSWSRSRAALVKFDAAGNVIWQRGYGPAAIGGGANAFFELPSGDYLIAGGMMDPAATSLSQGKGFAMKICANGDSVWHRTYSILGPTSFHYMRGFALTSDGGFAVAGFLHPRPPDTGTADVWVFKADANGYLQPGGAAPPVACAPVGLPDAPTEAPQSLEIYPNPAPDGRFTLTNLPPKTTLDVYDALGRRVWHANAPNTSNSPAETSIGLTRHPPGIYFLRATTPNGGVLTLRLVK